MIITTADLIDRRLQVGDTCTVLEQVLVVIGAVLYRELVEKYYTRMSPKQDILDAISNSNYDTLQVINA